METKQTIKEQSLEALNRLDSICAQTPMNRIQHYQSLNDVNLLTKELERLYKIEESMSKKEK